MCSADHIVNNADNIIDLSSNSHDSNNAAAKYDFDITGKLVGQTWDTSVRWYNQLSHNFTVSHF